MNANRFLVMLAAAGALLVSCTTNGQDSDLQILSLVPPTSAGAADAGNAELSCNFLTTTVGYPVQQFNVTRPFSVGIVIENHLANNANATLGRLNTNDFNVTQIVVTYESTDGTVLNEPQQINPAEGLVPASSAAAVGGVVIPGTVVADLASVTSVRLHIHVEGKLLDGTTVKTNEYLATAIPTTNDEDSSSCVFAQ